MEERRCVYCQYKYGDTREHLIPRSFIRHIEGRNNFDGNIVYACHWCNKEKDDRVILPTVSNIHSIFQYVPMHNILSIVEWCYLNRKAISRFRPDLTSELNEVCYLYDRCYYDYLCALYPGDTPMKNVNEWLWNHRLKPYLAKCGSDSFGSCYMGDRLFVVGISPSRFTQACNSFVHTNGDIQLEYTVNDSMSIDKLTYRIY